MTSVFSLKRARKPYISKSKEEKRRKKLCGSFCLEIYETNAKYLVRTLQYFGEFVEYEGIETRKVFISSTGIPYTPYKLSLKDPSELRRF